MAGAGEETADALLSMRYEGLSVMPAAVCTLVIVASVLDIADVHLCWTGQGSNFVAQAQQ